MIISRGKVLSHLCHIQTGSEAHPTSYPMGTGDSFAWRKRTCTELCFFLERKEMILRSDGEGEGYFMTLKHENVYFTFHYPIIFGKFHFYILQKMPVPHATYAA
jgi:hypothetical protein